MTQTPQPQRPLMVVFHFGIYFLVYTQFLLRLGTPEVVEHFEAIAPNAIRNLLILLSFGFVGYLGLWNLRRFSIPWLLVSGGLLLGYAFHLGAWNWIACYIPLVAGLTCLPLWPMMKTP